MLSHHFAHRPFKGALTTQPFVDYNAKRILITVWDCLGLNLLRGHIGNSACQVLYALRAMIVRTLGYQSNTEITQQNFVFAS